MTKCWRNDKSPHYRPNWQPKKSTSQEVKDTAAKVNVISADLNPAKLDDSQQLAMCQQAGSQPTPALLPLVAKFKPGEMAVEYQQCYGTHVSTFGHESQT